ncbi:hypothetical protein ACH347_14710 [Saccharopolyspora sp. 5N102]
MFGAGSSAAAGVAADRANIPAAIAAAMTISFYTFYLSINCDFPNATTPL